jgi:TetR/AcrR family transcriptional regulator, fatty acid metabolism regulator protein
MDSTKDEKKGQIMRVAFETIKKYGIKRVTLEDIAHASGMATTSIYYYFPSKNALINDTITHFSNTILDQIGLVVESKQSPEQKLLSSWKIIFSHMRESGYFLNMDKNTMTQVVSLAKDLVNKFQEGYQNLTRKILLEGKKTGVFHVDDIDLWALFLSVGLMGLIVNENTQERILKDDKIVEKMSKLLLNGLLTR